jgi:hypothetical protein
MIVKIYLQEDFFLTSFIILFTSKPVGILSCFDEVITIKISSHLISLFIYHVLSHISHVIIAHIVICRIVKIKAIATEVLILIEGVVKVIPSDLVEVLRV